MNEYDDIVDFRTAKEKREGFKFRIQQKWRHFKEWVKTHIEEIATFFLTAMIFARPVLREIAKINAQNKTEHVRKATIYDRSAGFYWELKREPTTRQKKEIDERHRNGESYREILEDMNLI